MNLAKLKPWAWGWRVRLGSLRRSFAVWRRWRVILDEDHSFNVTELRVHLGRTMVAVRRPRRRS